MIDFTGLTSFATLRGNVIKVTNSSGSILWEKSISPSINYIDAVVTDGLAYINTGIYPNQNTRIVMDISIQSSTGNTTSIYGGRTANGNASRAMWFMKSGQVRSDYAAATQTMVCPAFGTRFTIDSNKNVTTVNGVSHTHAASTFQSSAPLTLFAMNSGGEIDARRCKLICWSAKIYNGNTLLVDYRPCIDTEGVVCFYDEVAKSYVYPQDGTLASLITDENAITVTFYDDGNATDRFLTELGTLTVGGTKIVNSEQTIPLPSTNSVEVVYSLTSTIKYARKVKINGTEVGSIQNAGSSISKTVSIASGDTIAITFEQQEI